MKTVNCMGNRTYSYDVAKTALLVIDLQYDFLAPDGRIARKSGGESPFSKIVPRASLVLNEARRVGLPIIHTREGYRPDQSDVNNLKREMGYVGVDSAHGPLLIRGGKGHDFFDPFQPLEGELIIDKPGFSAFYGTTLEATLRDLGTTHLVLMGITTQCCVHSTLRSAVDRGFYCLTIEDCCAAETNAIHTSTLEIIQAENHLFGWITESEKLINSLTNA